MKFKTDNFFYIYDVNSNEILRVNEIIYDIIDDIDGLKVQSLINKYRSKHNASEIKKNVAIIIQANKANNYFPYNRPDIIQMLSAHKSDTK